MTKEMFVIVLKSYALKNQIAGIEESATGRTKPETVKELAELKERLLNAIGE